MNLIMAACSLYLLDKVHTFGRLHPVCIVYDVWDVILGAHSRQLFQPRR